MKSYLLFLCLTVFCFVANAQSANDNDAIKKPLRDSLINEAAFQRSMGHYVTAIQYIDSVLVEYPDDVSMLLFKGDVQLEAKQYNMAVKTLKQLLKLNPTHKTAKINLSYALFMSRKPVKALDYAEEAWSDDNLNTNAIVNYFNALLWNGKTKKAAVFLEKNKSNLDDAQIKIMLARLYTSSGNFSKGLKQYDELMKQYPNKHYLMEYADVLLGKNEIDKATSVLNRKPEFFSATDLKSFSQKVNARQQQQVGAEVSYFKDVGQNTRLESTIFWNQREDRRFRFGVRTGYSNNASAEGNKTNSQFAHLSLLQRWNRKWHGHTEIVIQHVSPANISGYISLTGKQLIRFQPHDRRMIALYYKSELLNYTATLLQMNVRSHNIGYVTHLMAGSKFGVFSEGSWGALDDGNQRFQFFGSAYYALRNNPTVKAGLNFSALHYKDNKIEIYFSPNRFLSSELFAEYNGNIPGSKSLYLQLQIAAGGQQIEKFQWEPAFRIQSELSLRLKHFQAALHYKASNVASSSGTGYKFNQITFKVAWRW
jgi:tetratricopeptide (TPR) repeat protein